MAEADVLSRWQAVIGMEVHVQLDSRSKMFCSCSSDYLAAAPNSNVCPVCLGMPGVLPVINRRAVEQCVRAALALGCEVARWTKFDRKNYFYPDLPKGYQISQYDLPIGRAGRLEVDGRVIRITRVHLEEDTGKLIHAGDRLASGGASSIDLNRAGLPLMEIVSEPDLRGADEARDYAMAIRELMRHLGVSEADMERGQLRAEANVSIHRPGTDELGVKTELKNINSFRALQRAVEQEIDRQIAVVEGGGAVVQETRGWSDAEQRTYSQRRKEFADDYRYFPEPDLPPLELEPGWVERLRVALPELPAARRRRFQDRLLLSAYDAGLLIQDRAVADYFEALVAVGAPAKAAANWVIGEVMPRLGGAREPGLTPERLAELISLVESGTINRDQGRQVLDKAWGGDRDPGHLVSELGLAQLSDEGALAGIVDEVLAANPEAAADYRAGKRQALGALIQRVKAATGGRADPRLAGEMLQSRLNR
ncbi:MAG: Asp-tRNA(Asn)/Glu-tRNA(Gln) amidotransferase subunit GatB [Candidatus Dormibacteraceae bacterium]